MEKEQFQSDKFHFRIKSNGEEDGFYHPLKSDYQDEHISQGEITQSDKFFGGKYAYYFDGTWEDIEKYARKIGLPIIFKPVEIYKESVRDKEEDELVICDTYF